MSAMTLHHMPTDAAITTMARLLRPGGRLAVVGADWAGGRSDLWRHAAGFLAHRWHTLVLRKQNWEHPSPCVDQTESYAETKAIALRLLPGARLRRLAMWRYLLTWTKPSAA